MNTLSVANTHWNVWGHAWAVQMLQQHIASASVRHAYLFAGVDGIGKRTLALAFAQALNCPEPISPGIPCGKCRVCIQIKEMKYVDLTIAQADSIGGTLKVDQVRALQHRISLTAVEAQRKVAILLRFHEANQNAQNALLKTLEEAPGNTVLILTAQAAESLLPTIVSRCEVLRLRPMRLIEATDTLHEHWQLSHEEAERMTHLSGGRLGFALRLRNQPEMHEQYREWLDDLEHLLKAPRRERFRYSEKVSRASDREGLRSMLMVWLSYWRDIFLFTADGNAALQNCDRLEVLKKVGEQVGYDMALSCIRGIDQALEQVDANVNQRLLLDTLLLDWPIVSSL
jgi:DNA polymerase III subunit delta'